MAFALTVNVPVVVRPRFVDVWANDTSKNSGKGYGSQVSMKGSINGKDELIYFKGFTNENIGQLVDAGVIAPTHYEHDPAEKYSIPVIGKHEVTLVLEQPAGQKWPKMKITSGHATNGTPPIPSPTAATPAPPKVVPSDNGGYDRLVEQYAQCMDSVTEVMKQRSVQFSDSAYVAAVATLFIQRERAGV